MVQNHQDITYAQFQTHERCNYDQTLSLKCIKVQNKSTQITPHCTCSNQNTPAKGSKSKNI